MYCSLDEVPEIRFVTEENYPVYNGDYDVVGVSIRSWLYDRDDVVFIVRKREDESTT
jgi:hypothetical protein